MTENEPENPDTFQVMVGIQTQSKVVVSFDRPFQWVSMGAEDAKRLGVMLIAKAGELDAMIAEQNRPHTEGIPVAIPEVTNE